MEKLKNIFTDAVDVLFATTLITMTIFAINTAIEVNMKNKNNTAIINGIEKSKTINPEISPDNNVFRYRL